MYRAFDELVEKEKATRIMNMVLDWLLLLWLLLFFYTMRWKNCKMKTTFTESACIFRYFVIIGFGYLVKMLHKLFVCDSSYKWSLFILWICVFLFCSSFHRNLMFARCTNSWIVVTFFHSANLYVFFFGRSSFFYSKLWCENKKRNGKKSQYTIENLMQNSNLFLDYKHFKYKIQHTAHNCQMNILCIQIQYFILKIAHISIWIVFVCATHEIAVYCWCWSKIHFKWSI